MEIHREWDAAPFLGKLEYTNWLQSPPAGTSDWVPPSLPSLDSVLARRRERFADPDSRRRLVEGLRESHLRRGAPQASLANVDRLSDPDAFLVITGQQPGLLGGPLLIFYKALHAVTLARRLSVQRGELFLPAFWDAAEDHDFPEIARFHWPAADHTVREFEWKTDSGGRRPYFEIPVRDLPLGDLLGSLRETTPPSEFREEVLDAVSRCAERANSYPDFFDALLWTIFEPDGLLILRPDDLFLRRAARPILEREILEPRRSPQAVEDAGRRVRELGGTPQIHKRAGRTAFFLIRDGERLAVDAVDQGFRDEKGGEYSAEDLLRRLRDSPESFSPSAVLRPVVQDAVLPTAAAVLGPSELAYHFLLDGIYQFHHIPRPCLVPRIGFTILESRDKRLLDKLRLSPLDLAEDASALVKRVTREQGAADLENLRTEIEESIRRFFQILCERAMSADPTICKVLEKNQSRVVEELQRSEQLLIRRQADRAEQVRGQIVSLQNALRPSGVLQERCFCLTVYLMKYGFALINEFRAAAEQTPDGEHVFVSI